MFKKDCLSFIIFDSAGPLAASTDQTTFTLTQECKGNAYKVSLPGTIFIILFFSFNLLAQTSGNVQEQKCADLGSECYCSETLNLANGLTGLHPTIPSSKKSCGFIESKDNLDPIHSSQIGLNGNFHVLRAKLTSSGFFSHASLDFSNKTYCSRQYIRFSQGALNYPNDSDLNFKGPRWEKNRNEPHPGVETTWKGSTSGGGSFNYASGYQSSTFGDNPGPSIGQSSGTSVGGQDCKDSWCRLEFCFDHNAKNDNKLTWRYKLTAIKSGKSGVGFQRSPNSSTRAVTGYTSHFVKWSNFCSTKADPSDCSQLMASRNNNYIYFSHLMVVIKNSVNENYWIGGAEEVEGENSIPQRLTLSPPGLPFFDEQ